MKLEHRSAVTMPDLNRLKDQAVKEYGEELALLLTNAFKHIFDDISRIIPQTVTDLPAASREYYQRFLIKNNSSAEDTLHLCIYDDSAGNYSWKEITLT